MLLLSCDSKRVITISLLATDVDECWCLMWRTVADAQCWLKNEMWFRMICDTMTAILLMQRAVFVIARQKHSQYDVTCLQYGSGCGCGCRESPSRMALDSELLLSIRSVCNCLWVRFSTHLCLMCWTRVSPPSNYRKFRKSNLLFW